MSGTRGQGARRRRHERRASARKQAVRIHRSEELLAAASGKTGLPLGPRDAKWDASAAESALRSWAGAGDGPNAKYASAFMVKQNDGSKFGDYKLQYAEPEDGTLTANWGAITAIAGVLQGARGGANITPEEASAAKSKVESYYKAAAKKYGDENIKVPWQSGASAAITLAYAQLGPEADPAEFSVLVFAWEQEFAPVVQGKLVWDEESGVMDLMDDLTELLNQGGMGRWCVIDVATSMDSAIVCNYAMMVDEPQERPYGYDGAGASYWLVPFTVGDDREPVLSAQSEWTPLESGWVEDSDALSARLPWSTFQMGECENCGHAFSSHEGNEGACQNGDCPCMSFEAPVTSADNDFNFGTPVTDSTGNTFLLVGQSASTPTTWVQSGPFTFVGANGTGGVKFDFVGDSITVTPPEDTGGGEVEWSAVLAPEGRLTSDGRAFAPGAISWPRLDDGPLSLMAMTETSEGGHIGAKVAGKITDIWRDEHEGLIRAKGTFDTSEYGQEIARMVSDQVLRGVSVDLAVHKAEAGPRSAWFDLEGNWAPKLDEERTDSDEVPIFDRLYNPDDPDIAVVFDAEIGMTTVCPFPAFADARIALGDSLAAGASSSPELWTVTAQGAYTVSKAPGALLTASGDSDGSGPCQECQEQGSALTASAAGLVAEAPPAVWFEDPKLDGPTALTVDDEGRVYGHACLWNSCHIGFPGRCIPPPRSETGYACFHLGEMLCADGERVSVGTITLDTGHATNGIGRADTVRHYDDTGTAVAYVKAGEDEYGVWVAGTLAPNVDAEKARIFMAGKPSGDWRNVNGNLELVAILTVNVPGFPVPRTRAAFQDGKVVSLVAAGIPIFETEIEAADREKFKALIAADEFAALAEA